jgi:FG-GAP-like repeat/IPT/TIG domain/FG-GAP repeat
MLKLYPRGELLLVVVTVLLPCFVFAQPVVNAVTPLYGPVNSTVTITGSNFSSSTSGNIVWFGSVRVPVTAATSGSLTVAVPTGISYAPITVTTAGLTSTPFQPFITTFSDTGQFTPAAFATRTDFNTGTGPQSICSIDLDGDGKPDLIIADGDSNIVSVYRNTSTPGSISFVEQASYFLGVNVYPIGVTAGDLDGDGKPEIVVSNYYTSNLSVFLNTSTPGSISMAPAVNYPTGSYTLSAVIADLNGDGKPEIIVASSGDDVLSTYTNNSTIGNLNFLPKVDWSVPSGSYPFRVAVSDLDGDGKLDIAAANATTNLVSVFRNISTTGGAVSFAAHVDFATGNYPQGLAIGDLDGDGKPDLAVVNNSDNTVSLLRNTGSSGTISFATHIDVQSGVGAYDLVIADLDGDGKADLAVVDEYNSVSVHRNTSTPGTISVTVNTDYATGNSPFSITTADYDGDGKPDLATANNTAASLSVLRNKASNEPSITSFSPMQGVMGTVVTITGVNLTGVTAVSFGDTAATSFTVVSPTTVTAVVGGGASGAVTLVAANGGASLAGFIYGAAPVINIFSPDSGVTGETILIKGTGFTGASSVTFGGTPANSYSVQSDSVITAVVGVGASGNVSITAATGSGSLAGFQYIYTPIPPVALTGFSPTSAGPGANITITGMNLSGITSMSFGGTPVLSFRVLSDSVIDATLGEGSTGDLVVSGNNGTDSLPGFVYLAPPPPLPSVMIKSFIPTSGSIGTTVTITGTALTAVTNVNFGGTPAISFTVISDSLILAVVGTGATGDVSVANVSSVDSLPGFVYVYDSLRVIDTPAAFKLLDFSGAYSGDDPLLQWQTANDGIISYYALERSTDNNQFVVIATVTPGGTNPGNHIYTFSDVGHDPGLNYYRLRMQDTTVAYSYSATISVQPAGKSSLLNLYPNPVLYGFTNVNLPDAGTASWFQLVDMNGKVLKTQLVAAGTTQVRVDFSGVHPGIYKLMWGDGTHSAYQSILVLAK